GIDNMDKQIGSAMSAHAGEIRSKIATFIFENMASGAVGREEFVTVLEVGAGLLDGGLQLSDECVFLLLFRSVKSVNDGIGAGGDGTIGVGAQPMEICGP